MIKLPKLQVVFDRKHETEKDSRAKGIVEIRITHNYKQKYVSTGVRCEKQYWSVRDGKVVKKLTCITDNERIAALYERLNEEIVRAYKNKETIDLATIVERAKTRVTEETFIEFVKKRAQERAVSAGTRLHYDLFADFLERWGKIVTFGDVTVENIQAMHEALSRGECVQKRKLDYIVRKEGQAVSDGTLYNYHKLMKLFINDAIIAKKLQENPYKYFKVRKPNEENIEYLTEEEMKRVMEVRLEDPVLQQTRDLFVFGMFTGLSYSDMVKFDIEQYTLEDGVYYRTNDRRSKTGVRFYIVLLKPAMDILEKYDMKLPIIPNEQYNKFLKQLAGKCDIKKRMHAHLSRHTFATYMLSNGCSIQNVSVMMGHTNIRQTLRYAKVLAKDVKADFLKINEKWKGEAAAELLRTRPSKTEEK